MATEKLVVKYLAWVLLCWLYHVKELLSTSEIFRDGGKFEFNWKVDWKITNVMCYRINFVLVVLYLGGVIQSKLFPNLNPLEEILIWWLTQLGPIHAAANWNFPQLTDNFSP